MLETLLQRIGSGIDRRIDRISVQPPWLRWIAAALVALFTWEMAADLLAGRVHADASAGGSSRSALICIWSGVLLVWSCKPGTRARYVVGLLVSFAGCMLFLVLSASRVMFIGLSILLVVLTGAALLSARYKRSETAGPRSHSSLIRERLGKGLALGLCLAFPLVIASPIDVHSGTAGLSLPPFVLVCILWAACWSFWVLIKSSRRPVRSALWAILIAALFGGLAFGVNTGYALVARARATAAP